MKWFWIVSGLVFWVVAIVEFVTRNPQAGWHLASAVLLFCAYIENRVTQLEKRIK